MLSVIAMLQTSFFKFFLTPYYSSSWDVTILLYESREMITTMRKTFRNEISSSKMEFFIFFKNFHILSFFWLRGVTFILILNLDKSYKRKNPSG